VQKHSGRGRMLQSSVIEFEQSCPHHIARNEASLKLQRFDFFVRFLGLLLIPCPFELRLAGVPRTFLKF
jgi:hypothetical protein